MDKQIKRKINAKNFSPLFVICIVSLGAALIRQNLFINIIDLPFDDGLFVAVAEGHILGNSSSPLSEFGFNSLVKGITYPWLITLSHFSILSPLTLSYLLYIIGVSAATLTLIKNNFHKIFLFTIMTFQPLFLVSKEVE